MSNAMTKPKPKATMAWGYKNIDTGEITDVIFSKIRPGSNFKWATFVRVKITEVKER